MTTLPTPCPTRCVRLSRTHARAHLRVDETRDLKRLKKADEDIEDADTRRYVFTNALRKVTVEQFKEDGYTEKDFNAVAEMDDQVYDGILKWSAITGEGKDLEAALAVTRAGRGSDQHHPDCEQRRAGCEPPNKSLLVWAERNTLVCFNRKRSGDRADVAKPMTKSRVFYAGVCFTVDAVRPERHCHSQFVGNFSAWS